MPTRYPNEGQPISILEAMGNGMFIITTDHAGIPDIVEDGINGVLLRATDNLSMISEKNINRITIKTAVVQNRLKVKERYIQERYIAVIETLFLSI
mgnify:FL=1